MNRFLFIFGSLVLAAALLAQTDFFNLNPVQTEVRNLLQSRREAQPGQPFDLKQLKELRRALMDNRPNVWRIPGPMLAALQHELEPLRTEAKLLAESTLSEERYYGASLNSYLKQTDETRALLLKLAHDERPETAGTAMDTLFGLKLDTPELRAELVEALQEDRPDREKSTLHAMAMNNAGVWGVTEAIPALIKMLEVSVAKGGPINGPAVMQIKALGPQAKNALPLLRRLAEMRRAAGDADFKELEALDFAVQVISAESKAPQASSVQSQQASTPSVVPPPARKNYTEANPTPTPTPTVEPASSTPWIIVVLIVVACGLLWLLLERRA